MKTKQELGRIGERLAENHLVGAGLEPVARNWRPGRLGEIDLVMKQGPITVFVEVKTRSHPGVSEAVDARKVAQLCRLVSAWFESETHWTPYRIDAVGVEMSGETPAITWWQGIDR